jgi:hypothetical protein
MLERNARGFASRPADTAELLALTRERLVHVVPDNHNFDPLLYWACGIQLVALELQLSELVTDLNDALFRDNGGVGFVLKPDILLNPSFGFNPHHHEIYDPNWAVILKLHILSGFLLPSAPGQKKSRKVWPFVQVQVLGVRSESQMLTTPITATAGGFHAVWNADLSFNVAVPQLAFVRFEVLDSSANEDFVPVVASYTSRLLCLRFGFCTVTLVPADRSLSGRPHLFVRVDIHKKDGCFSDDNPV